MNQQIGTPTPSKKIFLKPNNSLKYGSKRREEWKFYLFILPWIVGFLAFFIGPALVSFIYSFSDYNAIQAPNWIGFENYKNLLHDHIFQISIKNTLYFIAIGVPINIIFQVLIALILNMEVKGIYLFRTFYYLPYLVPTIATVILWSMMFNNDFGVINQVLSWAGIDKVDWLDNTHLIKPVIISMGMWASGSGVLIFLAGLKGIPKQLYEASMIDGAGTIKRFFHITLPMLTPTILFTLVMQIISYFQMFTESYLLNRGGPDYSSTTYMLNTYNTAFQDFHFGLAMAQSWILFLIILVITVIVLKTSKKWVYYEAGDDK